MDGAGEEDPSEEECEGLDSTLPSPLREERGGNTRLGMAEKFRGWLKGRRLSCLQPAEAASGPRWRGTCCSSRKLILEAAREGGGEDGEGATEQGVGRELAKRRVELTSFDEDT